MKKTAILTLSNLMFTAIAFAEDLDIPPPPVREQGLMQTLVMFAVVLFFLYFILWRPEQQRRQEMDAKVASLDKGQRVVAMGIVGTVSRVDQDTVILRMVDGSKIEVLKNAISDIGTAQESEKQ